MSDESHDDLRDWHARNAGWERHANHWSHLKYGCQHFGSHPFPPTIDAAVKEMAQ